MDFALTDTQRQLAETAQAFVSRSWSTARLREVEASELGFDADLWKLVSDLGWPGLLVSEEHGGSGQGMVEFAVLCEELGRGLFRSPLITSTTLAALPLLWAGTPDQQQHWLPGLAAGTTIGTLFLPERVLAPWAGGADLVLVASGDELVALDPRAVGVSLTRHQTLGGDQLFDVAVDPDVVLAAGSEVIERAVDHAAVASLAYQVGAAERALELSVEHAETREQFGRPIGSFQAVAHRCVDMRADIDACRYLAYQAAWALDHRPAADLEVAAAKAYANDALRRVYTHAHQVHGALGFSTEHDLHLFTRQAKAFELTYGSTAHHHDRVATAMGL
jgi:alkylation response protein AidB-like acyl-CoA dehydrogenase